MGATEGLPRGLSNCSACSACGGCLYGLDPLDITLEHSFACEHCAWKREFIIDHAVGIKHIFSDAKDLCSDDNCAFDHVSKCMVEVPAADIVVFGFSCVSVSSL